MKRLRNMPWNKLWAVRRDVAGAALHWSGASSAYELAKRPEGAIILMYHSVAPDDAARFVEPRIRMSPERFERQMRFLSRYRRVVPLSEVVDRIAAGDSPPAGTVCITFDDGYLDNLTVAAGILGRYRLPATLFLPTGYITRGEPQWGDVLHWLLEFRTRDRLAIEALGVESEDLAVPERLAAVRRMLHRRLLESDHESRVRLLGELEAQLRPTSTLPRLTMNWDDVRSLRRRYPLIEIGGHSRDHVDLRRHRGEAMRSQILGCAQDLRRELEVQPEHFSFPYERWCAESREAVRVCGWKSAVGAGSAFRITGGSDRFAMPRVESPQAMTALRFKTSGGYPGALAMLGLT